MKVRVHITSTITGDGEKQTADQTVNGFLRRCENSIELSYREEGGDEALGNTTTLLRFFEDRLELSRRGDYRGLLIMEPGKTVDCDYQTPFGALTLTTVTSRLHAAFSDDGGEAAVCYTLSAGSGVSKHELKITVKPLP